MLCRAAQRCLGFRTRLILACACVTAMLAPNTPKSLQGKAEVDLQAIWMAETREAAISAFNSCVVRYRAKYPKATDNPPEEQREAA